MEENVYPVIIVSGPGGKAIAQSFWQNQTITVGRGEENDIALLDADKKVSRQHLRLDKRGDDIYLYDLNSRNGTILNNQKIEGEPSAFKLSPNDEVRIGDYTLRLYLSVGTSEHGPTDHKEIADADTMEHSVASYQLIPSKELPLSSTTIARREKLARLVIEEPLPRRSGLFFWAIALFLFATALTLAIHLDLVKKLHGRFQSISPPEHSEIGPAVDTVRIKHPAEGDEVVLQGSGYVTVRRQVAVKSLIDGEVEYITVREGEKVKEGQTLAQLDQSDFKVELNNTRTQLEIARLELTELENKIAAAERQLKDKEKLYQKNLLSKMEIEQARDEYKLLVIQKDRYQKKIESANHKIESATSDLKKTLITAPFDGEVIKKSCEVGAVVEKQRDTLFIVVDRAGIGATIDVNERHLPKISLHQPVELALDAYENRKYSGKVRQVNPMVDKQKGTVAVDIAFIEPDALILPNMGVKASFQLPKEGQPAARILVPASAVCHEGEKKIVWLVSAESTAQKRMVGAGNTFGDQVEIVSGLSGGEEVIISDAKDLREGTKVRRAK